MATGIYSWSQTAATNATADSEINWAEGQAPSTVNDSARAVMRVLSKWRDDISGVQPANVVQTSAGTANAQTLTTNASIAALTNGWTLTFKAGATNTTACTLAVDSLTAKQIQIVSGTNLIGGEILTGCTYTVTYHQPADAWILNGYPVLATAAQMVTGTDTHRVPAIVTVKNHEGVAKAWGTVTNSGSPTLDNSYGVTSISDGGEGVTSVTLSVTMDSANYAVIVTPNNSDNISVTARVVNRTTTTFDVITEEAGANRDRDFTFVVFGTLA